MFIPKNNSVMAAVERLKKVRENERNGDVCWLSKVYDPLWTGESGWVHTYHGDMTIVSDAYIALVDEQEKKHGTS